MGSGMHEPIRVGRVEVSVVCEGYAPLELADEMPGAEVDWDAERTRHPWAFVDEGSWPWHVHAFGLRTPSGLVLVDAGVSPFPPVRPWAEHTPLEEALANAGVDPAEVRMVVHTHLHADHAGGSVVDGEPRYPNAVHVVHPADWTRTVGREHPNWARGAMQRLSELGMIDLGAEDREVWPGVRVVHAPGTRPDTARWCSRMVNIPCCSPAISSTPRSRSRGRSTRPTTTSTPTRPVALGSGSWNRLGAGGGSSA